MIVVFITFVLVFVAYWLTILILSARYILRKREIPEVLIFLLQYSIVACAMKFTIDLFRSGGFFIFDEVLFYIGAPIDVLYQFTHAMDYPFLQRAAAVAAIPALLIFAIVRFTDTPLARFAYGFAMAVFCATGLWVAADIAYRAQMVALSDRDVDCYERVSFLRSVALSQQWVKPEFHLFAFKDREPIVWSFRRFQLVSLADDDGWMGVPGIGLESCYGYDPRPTNPIAPPGQ